MGQSLVNLTSYVYTMSSLLGGSLGFHSRRFEPAFLFYKIHHLRIQALGADTYEPNSRLGVLLTMILSKLQAPLSLSFFICEMEIIKAPVRTVMMAIVHIVVKSLNNVMKQYTFIFILMSSLLLS